jgi:hypothetical protein
LYTDNNHKRNLKLIKVDILDKSEENIMKKFERLTIYPLLLVTRGKQMSAPSKARTVQLVTISKVGDK